MTPIITVTAIPFDVPLTKSDVHIDFLRDQLHAHAALGHNKVHGVSHDGKSARAHIPTTVDPKLAADITAALQGFESRLATYDIRAIMLKELQAKFPTVDNLALFTGTPTHPEPEAHVTVRGDYDPATVAAIHEVTATHDPAKAPPEPSDPYVLLLQTVQAMNEQMKGLHNQVTALEAQAAELKGNL